MTLNAHWNTGGSPCNVSVTELRGFIVRAVRSCGMQPGPAETFCDVLTRATLRGVGHHDVHDLPLRLQALSSREVNADPQIRAIGGLGALAAYDGDNGPGELCASFAMARACALAEEFGIGLCTIRASNHFLSAAPYVEWAAERGFLAVVLSRNKPSMALPGSTRKTIGNMPFGFASPTGQGQPLLLDACLAYASYGSLAARAAADQPVPATWGSDASGTPSTDPRTIIEHGFPSPIGGHKGLGLAMLCELLTSGLAAGCVLGERNPRYPNGRGIHGQTAIAIRTQALHLERSYLDRVDALTAGLGAIGSPVRLPGSVSLTAKRRALDAGALVLKTGVLDELDAWAVRLGVQPLRRSAPA